MRFASSNKSDGNMSLTKGSIFEAIKNRKKFLENMNLNLSETVCMSPTHGIRIKKVGLSDIGKGSENPLTYLKVDGLTTNIKNLPLFVTTGDCLPIAFYDQKNQAISLVHASWKNLNNYIINNAVLLMKKYYNSLPKNLLVQIGPSIGPCCYLHTKKPSQLKKPEWKKFIHKSNDLYSIDLWGFAQKQLTDLGVKKNNIKNDKLCTYHTDNYFSHRKFLKENLKYDFRFANILIL